MEKNSTRWQERTIELEGNFTNSDPKASHCYAYRIISDFTNYCHILLKHKDRF